MIVLFFMKSFCFYLEQEITTNKIAIKQITIIIYIQIRRFFIVKLSINIPT